MIFAVDLSGNNGCNEDDAVSVVNLDQHLGDFPMIVFDSVGPKSSYWSTMRCKHDQVRNDLRHNWLQLLRRKFSNLLTGLLW